MGKQIIIILGAILVIEGLPYLVYPGGLKKMMDEIRRLPDNGLRLAGGAAVAFGLVLVWIAGNMN